MQHRNFARVYSAALVAALIGFSGPVLAQQNAVQALDRDTATADNADQAQVDHSMANALAADLDAYNAQDDVNRGPATHVPADQPAPGVSRLARQLSQDVDAYNANATRGRLPQTHMPASDKSRTPEYERANEIANRIAAFNRSGGDLSSVRNLN